MSSRSPAAASRTFGRAGVQVASVGQGTWKMEQDDRAAAVAAIRRGLDAGMTHVDTAEMYGSGEVERIVADGMRGRRDEVFLVSKVLPSNASRAGTMKACERSLQRLRTDRLDCYLLHWRGEHPLEDTIAAFEQLEADGKIRSWGVSNFDQPDLAAALAIAGEGRIACNQVLYHLGERGIELDVLPWCARHGVAVVGYSPFGSGALPGPRTRAGALLAAVAAEAGATIHQLALAFLLREPAVLTIPKASRAAHVADNAGALTLTLSEAALARLDAAFPAEKRESLPTL